MWTKAPARSTSSEPPPNTSASASRRHAIIKEVAVVTATWRETAKETGARPAEITRMASAFEHDDLKRSLAL
jgi:hypothetical protein